MGVDKNGTILTDLAPNVSDLYRVEILCTSDTGIYFKTVNLVSGTIIDKETIYFWDGKKVQEIYNISYDIYADNVVMQTGNIRDMKVFQNELYYAVIEYEEGDYAPLINVYKLNPEGKPSRVSSYKSDDKKGTFGFTDICLLSETGDVAYGTKYGDVFLVKGGIQTQIYQSTLYDTSDFISIPWKLALDEANGDIYVTDIGLRCVRNLTSHEVIYTSDNSVPYRCTVWNGKICATDNEHLLLSHKDTMLQDSRRFTHSKTFLITRSLTWIALIWIVVCGLQCMIWVIRQIMNSLKTAFVRLSLFCICLVIISSAIVSVQTCGKLIENETSWTNYTIEQCAYTMKDYLNNNIEQFENITALSDYKSDDYRSIQAQLDPFIYGTYYADYEYNLNNNDYSKGSIYIKNPIYYALYKNVNGTICSVMDFEDSMCAIHPIPAGNQKEYKEALEGCAVSINSRSDANGDWQYMLLPFGDNEGSDPVGILEVGINHSSLGRVIFDTTLDIVLEIIFLTALFVMFLMEFLFLWKYYKEFKQKQKTGSKDELFGYIRFITLCTYFCDCLQDSFFVVAAQKLYKPFWGIPPEIGNTLPISLQMLFSAVFAVAAGKLVRKIPVKQMVMGGFCINGIGFLICTFSISGSYTGIMLGKVFIGAGIGILTSMANVSASSIHDKTKKGMAFASLNAGVLAGATLGFSIGSILASHFGYQSVYVLAIFSVVFAVLMTTKFMPDVQGETEERKTSSLAFMKDWKVLGFLFCTLLPFLVLINFREVFFVSYADANGYTEDFAGKLFLFCGLIIIYLGPILSDTVEKRIGDRNMVCLANGCFLSALIVFVCMPGMPAAIAGVFLISLGMSFGYTAQSEYFTNLPSVRQTDEGSTMGIYLLFDNTGQTLGPVIFGGLCSLGNRLGLFVILIGFLAMNLLFFISSLLPKNRSVH
ncbi:MAG: MFS transporter [Eubacteriales bacterium]|nr:MFS transporter [Eubacteriales bacterium]